jgi:lipoate-protein ligase A
MSYLCTSPIEEGSALEMMLKEKALITSVPSNPCLRVYLMHPGITYGYFIQPEKWLALSRLRSLSTAQRPTGGGLLFHGQDITFSLSLPSSHPLFHLDTSDRYQAINQKVLEALSPLVPSSCTLSLSSKTSLPGNEKEVCLANPTSYDLLCNGKKVGGSAQRKTKTSLLHQGYIQIFPLDKTPYEEALLSATLWEKIGRFSSPLFATPQAVTRKDFAWQFRESLNKTLCDILN